MSQRDFTAEEAELIGPLNAFGLITSTAVADSNPAQIGTLLVDDLNYTTAMTTGPQPGDYNNNGVVDAADYVLWREQSGTNVTAGTGADGTGDGNVNEADYAFWRERFGNSSGSANGTVAGAVPEPSTLGLALLAGLAMFAAGITRH
jgi:hypothetical protein